MLVGFSWLRHVSRGYTFCSASLPSYITPTPAVQRCRHTACQTHCTGKPPQSHSQSFIVTLLQYPRSGVGVSPQGRLFQLRVRRQSFAKVQK
eukprot:3695083-Amphidinium_carterae.2